jgi:hypothetical protein
VADIFIACVDGLKGFPEAIGWLTSTILTARRQLSWPVEAGDDFNPLLA